MQLQTTNTPNAFPFTTPVRPSPSSFSYSGQTRTSYTLLKTLVSSGRSSSQRPPCAWPPLPVLLPRPPALWARIGQWPINSPEIALPSSHWLRLVGGLWLSVADCGGSGLVPPLAPRDTCARRREARAATSTYSPTSTGRAVFHPCL